jgi:hypothetical protein
MDILPWNEGPTFHDLILTAYEVNLFPSYVVQRLKDGLRSSKKISLVECEQYNEKLYYCRKLYLLDYLPLRFHVLQQYQVTPESGYCTEAKTFTIID